MKNTWNYDLMDLLDDARTGKPQELKAFIEKYSPLAAVNEEYSALLLFRHFHADFDENEIRVLNCYPDGEHFLPGITIVTSDEDGGSQSNVYLPGQFKYKALTLQNNEVEIVTEEENIKTNVTELFRKLDFWDGFTKEQLDNAFNSLCNEQYEPPKKPEVENTMIHLPTLGEFLYHEQFEWYEGNLNINGNFCNIYLHYSTPEQFEKLAAFAETQIGKKFYKEMLLTAEKPMIELKNDYWLEEDEETEEEEQPITAEDFRQRVSIESIVFNENGSCSIYCNDDDIFWGHSIEIRVDEKGDYKSANLAG